MSLTRWLTLGSAVTVTVAALAILLAGPGVPVDSATIPSGSQVTLASEAPGDTSGAAQPAAGDSSQAADPTGEGSSIEDLASEGDENPVELVASDPDGASPSTSDTPTSATIPEAPAPTESSAASSVRLWIPDLEVDAAVTPLGFNSSGQLDAPVTAAGVGWYDFSAYPGAAGNSVLAGHLNWRGERGVFDRLDELNPGDLIHVDTPDGRVTYKVVGSYSVGAGTPFNRILGERSGPSTLTLFTCGGTFVPGDGYDERLIVDAVLI